MNYLGGVIRPVILLAVVVGFGIIAATLISLASTATGHGSMEETSVIACSKCKTPNRIDNDVMVWHCFACRTINFRWPTE